MSPTVQWHALETDAACRKLDSSREGLDESQAKDRLLRFGANELPRTAERRWLRLLAAQFRNILIL
ncbi:MAG: cation-transporting P-type ATPase, partial [Gammaproteobacteria bacterium]